MTSDTEYQIAAAIEGAEEIHNPLDGVVERAAADASTPFVPEVLQRLAALKKDDRAAFEALRAHLKNVGCRVRSWRAASDAS
jgi:hypothetical protein